MGQMESKELKQLVSESTKKIQVATDNIEINHIVENLVKQVMGTDYASLWVLQKESASLVRSRDDESINEISMLGQHGVLAKCFFTLSGGIFNYLASEKEYLPEVDNPDNIRIKSKIIIPLIDNENFLGMITAYASVKKMKNFTQDDMEILETLVPFLINVIYMMYPELKTYEEEVYVGQRLVESSEVLVGKVEEVQHQQQETEEGEETLNFLANTVHDIRTPANSLYGFLELLEEQLEDKRLLSYIQNAKESAHFINNMTTSILDRISSQRDRENIEHITLNPTKFFADIAETFSANMANKGITYNIYIDPMLPKEITIENIVLKRVLLNLLNNAYKFTPSKGDVTLCVQYKKDEKRMKVIVSDTGIGIAPEKQEEIFKAFTQAEDDTKQNYGGTGLGLTICAEYVDRLGGKLKLKSELEQGSSFYFSLPLEIHQNEKMFTPVKNRQMQVGIVLSKKNLSSAKNLVRYLGKMGIDKKQIGTLQKGQEIPEGMTHIICYQNQLSDKIVSESKSRNIPLLVVEEEFLSMLKYEESIISQYGYYANDLYEFIAGNQPLRILVADDDKINIALIKAILSEEFCHIDTVGDGEAALTMLQDALKENHPYQLVYLDKHMPIILGSEVITRYRKLEKEKNAKSIFAVSISGDGAKDDNSLELFDMYVGKPFNKKAIQETLKLARD
ncbi:multi-sensor hybrid histidine kinase [hydrothermal vent metagenome]|uniref:histidine kinase n=1 Tax=hydrothermal vent metagenome TaxID=652676 RepID=A0A1W1C2A2_9ZZZZ